MHFPDNNRLACYASGRDIVAEVFNMAESNISDYLTVQTCHTIKVSTIETKIIPLQI